MSQMTLRSTEVASGDSVIDGAYRYFLRRWWGTLSEDDRILLWILLNPSKADGFINDATLLRVMDFTRREGYHHLAIVNLYAWRSTNPKELRQAEDPIGPLNNHYIAETASRADKIIVGWGNNSFHFRDREVLDLLAGRELWTFGLTQKGQPRHPLYVKRNKLLIPLPRT